MPVELRCVRRTSRRTPPSRDAHRPNPNNLHRGGTTRRTSCPRVAPFIISDATGGVPGRAGRPAAGAIRGRGRRRAVVPGSRRRISHPYRAERPDEMVLVGEAAGWCPARSDVPRFAAHGGVMVRSGKRARRWRWAFMLIFSTTTSMRSAVQWIRCSAVKMLPKCCQGRCLCLMSVAVAPFSVLVFVGSIPAAPLNNKRHSARGGVFCWYSNGFQQSGRCRHVGFA